MRRKNLTKHEFNQIKTLQEANLKTKLIVEVTGRSPAVVHSVKRVETLEEYRALRKQAKPIKEVIDVTGDEQVLARLKNIESAVNRLLQIEEGRLSNEKVNAWKWGRNK
jgi:YbbR domain-containing protein